MFKERLYIKDLRTELDYRDRRSIKKWCRNNNVRILSDVGSNKKFVLREEFEKEKDRIYKRRFFVNNTSRKSSSHNRNGQLEKVMGYKPQGEYEKNTLSIFTNLISARYDTHNG